MKKLHTDRGILIQTGSVEVKGGFTMDDQRIIELYLARSETAIVETDRKYGAACRRLAERILANPQDAEECVNDTYLATWNAIPPAHPHPLSTFLFRITRNLSLKRYRDRTAARRDSRFDVSLDELGDCLRSPDTLESERESTLTAAAIERFLDTLSRENRVIFLRRYWFSDSYIEISKRVGLSEKSISMRLTRMRGTLKKFLEKEGIRV